MVDERSHREVACSPPGLGSASSGMPDSFDGAGRERSCGADDASGGWAIPSAASLAGVTKCGPRPTIHRHSAAVAATGPNVPTTGV